MQGVLLKCSSALWLGAHDGELLRRLPGVRERHWRPRGDGSAVGYEAELATYRADLALVHRLDAGKVEAAHLGTGLRARAPVVDGHLVLGLALGQLPRLGQRDVDVRQLTSLRIA